MHLLRLSSSITSFMNCVLSPEPALLSVFTELMIEVLRHYCNHMYFYYMNISKLSYNYLAPPTLSHFPSSSLAYVFYLYIYIS